MDKISREKKVISAMIRIYCRGRHGTRGETLCPECESLREYASLRLDKCRFGNEKCFCSDCWVHCYKPGMRERVRETMRYAGPRMLFKHPIMAIGHYFRKRPWKNGASNKS